MPAPVSQLVMVPIKAIKPYERNPRFNEATIDKLVELIPRVGFNVPILLDRQNVIIKGHSRYKAAQRLKMRALPCVYSDADEETNRLDRLADNRVHEFSTWDEEALQRELAGLNLSFNFDMTSLDFNFAVPPASPAVGSEASPAGSPTPAGDDPFITSEDVAGTVSGVANPEYLEVVCHECGHTLYVKP